MYKEHLIRERINKLTIERSLLYWLSETRKEPGMPLYKIALILSDILAPEEITVLVDNLKEYQKIS